MSLLDTLLEELRELIKPRARGYADHHAIRGNLERAFQLDESRYKAEWLPVLSASNLPTFFGSTLDDIEQLSRMLPKNAPITLSLRDPRFDYGVLADAPFTSCLTGITINHDCKVHDRHIERLMQSKHHGEVVRFDVGGNDVGDGAMIALAQASSIHKLAYLRLYHNKITGTGARALAESPLMGQLEALDISVNRIENEGAAALGASKHLGNLRKLNVSVNKIKRKGAEDFARANSMTRLEHLDFSRNNIGNHGALALANCPALSNLTSLSLGKNRINAKGVAHIQNSAHLTGLEDFYH